MEQNPALQPLFNIIESRKPRPLDQLASLRQTQEQLGLQGLEEQRRGIQETQEQLKLLQQQQPDMQKQRIERALLAAGDLISGSGGKASQLYQMFQPPDTVNQQTKLQQILGQQRQGLSKAELGLLDQQLTSQFQEAQLDLLGQRVQATAKGKEMDPLDRQLKQATLAEKQGKMEQKKSEAAAKSKSIQNVGKILVRDIEMAKDIINKGGAMATTFGGIPGLIPGTDARVLRDHIDSVKGNVAVDQLLEIKRQGSGLGQVPQSQLDMLSTLMGSLKPDLPPDILKQNLQDIEDIYADIVKKEGGDPFELYDKRQGKQGGAGALPKAPVYKSPTANKLREEWGL